MKGLENYILPILTALFGGGISYFFTRKKNRAETRSIEIENILKAVDIYSKVIEEQDMRIKEQDERIKQLNDELKILKSEIRELKKEFKDQCNNCWYKKEYHG